MNKLCDKVSMDRGSNPNEILFLFKSLGKPRRHENKKKLNRKLTLPSEPNLVNVLVLLNISIIWWPTHYHGEIQHPTATILVCLEYARYSTSN